MDDFLTYWDSIRNGKRLPGRQDLDPVDIPAMLPFVFLVDVLLGEMGVAFRYRLVGTDIVMNTKRDFTGFLLSDIRDIGSQGKLIALYERCVAEQAPVSECLPYKTRGGVDKRYEVVVAPLARDGQHVDMLLGYALHGDDLDMPAF